MSDSENQTIIPCCHHPEQRATHNCMHCGNPLCIDCVRQSGYYCSPACKEAVRASVPNAAPAHQEMEAVDQKLNRSLEVTGAILQKLKRPALVLVVVVIAFVVYRSFSGPRGRVTASVPVSSNMEAFHAALIDPDLVVCKADDSLFLVRLSSQQKLWQVDLHSLEEKAPPAGESGGADTAGDAARYRDKLELAAAQGNEIILHSQRQIVVLNRTGQVKWKYLQPESFLTTVSPHPSGVLCQVASRSPQLVNLALADGTPAWSTTNGVAAFPPPVIAGERLVLLQRDRDRATTDATARSADAGEEEVTAGPAGEFTAQKLLGMAKGGAPAKKGTSYTLQFLALADGSDRGQPTVTLGGAAKLQYLGSWLVLTGGPDLVVFETGNEPAWKTTLDGPVEHVAAGGGVIAAATTKSVVAFTAKSGQQKWTRAGVAAEHLAVGPDGAVYARISIPKNQATTGEAKSFRVADVVTGGRHYPGLELPVLLRLDPATGRTAWGVKYIGQDILFAGQGVYVVDRVAGMDLLANQGPFVSDHSVRELSPRTGEDRWMYIKQAELIHYELMGAKFFLVALAGPPVGNRNPTGNYLLQTVEGK